MSKIVFKKGDYFAFTNGFGIALSKKQSVTIEGKGGRAGYTTKKCPLPEDAVPHTLLGNISFEVQFALSAVHTAIM